MKTWVGRHKGVVTFTESNLEKIELGSINNITPIILTTRQAKQLRDCLLKAYSPRREVVISKVGLTCLGFWHRGEALWMTNMAAMLHDIDKIKRKHRNDAAEILSWTYMDHYDEIIQRINFKSSKNFKDFGHPNMIITADGVCHYLKPPLKDIE